MTLNTEMHICRTKLGIVTLLLYCPTPYLLPYSTLAYSTQHHPYHIPYPNLSYPTYYPAYPLLPYPTPYPTLQTAKLCPILILPYLPLPYPILPHPTL